MRLALLGLVLAGCMDPGTPSYPPDPGGPYYPPPPGYDGGGGPPPTYGCTADTQCATGNVCARDGECLPMADVRAIHVTWTLEGQAATATTCTNSPDLEIQFTSNFDGWWGYAPVPCMEGKFSIDKMPTTYTSVELLRDGDTAGGASGQIDAQTGTLALDLPY